MSWDCFGREQPHRNVSKGRRAPSCCFPPPHHPPAAVLEGKSRLPPTLQQSSAEGCRILQGHSMFSMQEGVQSKALAHATVHKACQAAGQEQQVAAERSGVVGGFGAPLLLPLFFPFS